MNKIKITEDKVDKIRKQIYTEAKYSNQQSVMDTNTSESFL